MALSADHDGKYVSANDSDGMILTSVDRQNALLQTGYVFEAVASQAAFVEAIALFYVSCERSSLTIEKQQELEQRLNSDRPVTFGTMVNFLDKLSHLPPTTKLDLKDYLRARNAIAHSMLPSFASINLEETYRIGTRIISELKAKHAFSAGIFITRAKK